MAAKGSLQSAYCAPRCPLLFLLLFQSPSFGGQQVAVLQDNNLVMAHKSLLAFIARSDSSLTPSLGTWHANVFDETLSEVSLLRLAGPL